MDTKHLLRFSSIILSLTILLFLNTDAKPQNRNMNFSVSTNNLYFPGDEVKLNIYSYDYSEKDRKGKESVQFNISILRIKDINDFYSKQSSRYNLDVLSKDSLNLTYLTEEVYSFKKYIKQKNDYDYFYVNESVPLNVNSKGAYLIRVTSDNKVAYCGFIVSALGVVSKAGNNSMLAFTVDRKSGAPVSGAELSFYIGKTKAGAGKTVDGLLFQSINYQEVNSGEDDKIPMIIGKFGDDIVVSDSYLYFGNAETRYYTYIYTQQPVYRTNSDVNFKGIIRVNNNSKLEPVSFKDIKVTIKDSKGAEVYKKSVKTNNEGSFDGTFRLEEEAPLGEYNIFAVIEDKYSYTSGFTVEQYKKPEYKVTVKTDKGQYFGKDNLKAEINAKYFFGSPVNGANVEYNIYRIKYYKPWWKFSEYAWWYEDYFDNQDDNQKFRGAEFLYSGNGILDNEGNLKIDFDINEDFKEEQSNDWWYRSYDNSTDYNYIVQAKVTDKSRREISGTASAFVTRGGFYMNVKTDKYLYKPNDFVNIEVMSNNFSDQPVQTEFEAVIYKTTWSRNNYNEKKDYVKTLSGKTLTDGKGVVSFNIGDGDTEGAYSVEVKAKDDRSNLITAGAYFYVSKGDMSWYYNQSGGVQIITDKDSYKKGEVCKALILLTNPDVSALVTTNTDDIISYSVEKFSGTSKMIEIPVTDKYISGFEINVNYVYNGTFVNSGKSVLVIPEDKFLTVQIDPSKLIYKPKEEGRIKVRVLDNSGNPVRNSEVSVGIVDESIYSIKEDNTKDIRKFFYGRNFNGVSTAFNTNNSSNGSSRLITIYERFNLKNLNSEELATVKGRLIRKNGTPVQNAIIVIDEDYQAGITDTDGKFEFRLPEGKYTISAYYNGITKDDLTELTLSKKQIREIILYNDKDINELLTEQNEFDGRGELRAGVTDKSAQIYKKKDGAKLSMDENAVTTVQSGMVSEKEFVQAEVRSDFKDAVLWSPYSVTDENGYAEVSLNFPDNLTEWRITSRVITEDTKTGQAVSTVITRKDLLIRMETPRFLQENDEVTISTIIHNYLSTAKKTLVRFKGDNIINENAGNEKTLTIEPNTDVRVDWKIKISEPLGEATLYAEALTNEESDAVEIKVPLQPKGLKVEINSVADFSDESKTESKSFNIPSGTDLRSAGLKLSVDASLASTVLTALDDLAGYPYGCVEQTMSRFLPTVVVADAFKEINAPVSEATKTKLPDMVAKGLQRLYSFQHSDGGWGWWENDNTNPYMTAYVVYGLALAEKAGYNIDKGYLDRGINSIKSQLSNNNTLDETTLSYMLYSIAVAKGIDEEFLKSNIKKINSAGLNDYSRSLLAMTWKIAGNEKNAMEELSKIEKNVKSKGDGTAYWEGKEFHYRWQDDKVQTTAMVLKAIIMINKNSDLKERVVRWLMMQRMGTSWRNTQETALVIFALVDYLKNSSELNPDYTVKVYINGSNVYEKSMTSVDVYKKNDFIKIDNKHLISGNNEIKIEKSGKGKIYFSGNISYYSSTENISAGESGFRIEREYFRLEKYNLYNEEKIIYRKKYFDGNIKFGDDMLVKLHVYSKEDNQYFMLEDPLPAGMEIVKDDWSFTIEDESNYTSYPYYRWRWWYADKEVRDNRVTFFATYIGKGEYEFSYILHAQIPGEYNVNPAKGMLMYYTDYNGNTENMKINISE